MNHHVYADFGISKYFYRSKSEILGGIGQGNLVSGAACQLIMDTCTKLCEAMGRKIQQLKLCFAAGNRFIGKENRRLHS